MALSLEKRYFEHLVPAGSAISGEGKAAFLSDKAWASFTRLIDSFESVLEQEFGPSSGWGQSVSSVYRSLWTGDLDPDIIKLSDGLSEMVDCNKQVLLGRVKEFAPIARLLSARELQGANVRMAAGQEEPKEEKKEQHQGSIPSVEETDGDVTSEIAPNMSAAEKKQLCDKLNAEALKNRNREMEQVFNQLAAECFRTRVHIFKSTDECKTFMETTAGGIVARTVLVDWTMPEMLQAGPKSRLLAKAPPKDMQKQLANEVKMIPMRPVLGHVLARANGAGGIEAFDAELETTHAYKRSILVPVEIPEEYMRYLRSASVRSHGPTDDVSSGIDFVMYTVGRQRTAGNDQAAAGDDDDDADAADTGAVLSISVPWLCLASFAPAGPVLS